MDITLQNINTTEDRQKIEYHFTNFLKDNFKEYKQIKIDIKE